MSANLRPSIFPDVLCDHLSPVVPSTLWVGVKIDACTPSERQSSDAPSARGRRARRQELVRALLATSDATVIEVRAGGFQVLHAGCATAAAAFGVSAHDAPGEAWAVFNDNVVPDAVRSALTAAMEREVMTRLPVMLLGVDHDVCVLPSSANEALCVIRESRFAPGAAHDLNNCLTAVACASGALLGDAGLSADGRAAVREILDALRRAELITGRMLTGARVHAHEAEPLDLERELRSVLALMRRSMPSQVSLRSDIDVEVPYVRLGAEQLQRVVMNLVSNARHAIDEDERHGTVWVRAWGEATKRDGAIDRAVLEVSDDGRGMTPEVLGRVFEPWFTTRAAGNGLGMSSVRELVRAAGGTVRITSRENEGTTVTVTLPAFIPRASSPHELSNVTARDPA